MAVPKKKVSYSRTRIRLLSKNIKFKNYIDCKRCQNFKNIHSLCSVCFISNKSPLTKLSDTFITNINTF